MIDPKDWIPYLCRYPFPLLQDPCTAVNFMISGSGCKFDLIPDTDPKSHINRDRQEQKLDGSSLRVTHLFFQQIRLWFLYYAHL